MLAPPSDNVESTRIKLLHALHLLDTDPEPVFDRVTRLLAQTLDVPIALVSLIDTDRQWFKSVVGLQIRETPRDLAFCDHAIRCNETMVVEDATRDDRFANNQLVIGDPQIRFYAGAPLRTGDGYAMGTLCAIDSRPRRLSTEQAQILEDLAQIVSREFQLREADLLSRSQMRFSDRQIKAAERKFEDVFEQAGAGMALVAPDGRWLRVNRALKEIIGYSDEQLEGLTFQDITLAEDLEQDLAHLNRLTAGEIDRYEMEKRYIRRDRSIVWVNMTVTQYVDDNGKLDYYLAVINDIQARKEAEKIKEEITQQLEQRVNERTRDLKQREAELRAILEHTNDAYVCMDEKGIITAWNRKAELTFGWSRHEAIGGQIDAMLTPTGTHQPLSEGMNRYMACRDAQQLGQRLEFPAQRKDGSTIPVEVHINAIHDDNKTLFNAFLHEISERKLKEVKREREALQDALTGLLNRRAMMETLPRAIIAARTEKRSLALLFIDLDGFKAVNDVFGHDIGDELLKTVSQRLLDNLRGSDSVFRLAGDEFTVLLDHADSLDHARAVADKLRIAISEPLQLRNNKVHLQASIGLSLFANQDPRTPEQLVRDADSAMYRAKRGGRNQVEVA